MSSVDAGEFIVFAPDASDAVECEFQAHELKTWMGRFHLNLVHVAGREEGYDPYNSAPAKTPDQQPQQ